jgi:hypothetical protein
VILMAAVVTLVGVDRMTHRVRIAAWACDGTRSVRVGALLHGHARDAARVRVRWRGPVVIVGDVRPAGDVLEVRPLGHYGRGVGACCARWSVRGDVVECVQGAP